MNNVDPTPPPPKPAVTYNYPDNFSTHRIDPASDMPDADRPAEKPSYWGVIAVTIVAIYIIVIMCMLAGGGTQL